MSHPTNTNILESSLEAKQEAGQCTKALTGYCEECSEMEAFEKQLNSNK